MTSKVHEGMAGDSLEVESGGVVEVKSGGRINLEAGAALNVPASALKIADVAVTPVAAELNSLTGEPASVAMTTTPASGTCAVQLTFKDSAGATLAHLIAGLLYFSTIDGTAIAAPTSNATLTNGAIQELVAGKVDLFITSAAGLLGFTVTKSGGGTFYASLVLPNGKVLTTAAIVVNA